MAENYGADLYAGLSGKVCIFAVGEGKFFPKRLDGKGVRKRLSGKCRRGTK